MYVGGPYADWVEGLGGYNCYHQSRCCHGEGDRRYKDDPLKGTGYTREQAYEARSQQRAMENDIRRMKRQKGVLEANGLDAHDVNVRIRAKQAQLRKHVEEHRAVLKRDSWREQLPKGRASGNIEKLVSSSANPMGGPKISWPQHGIPITRNDFKELRSRAAKHGIKLNGFRRSDIDVRVARRMIDAAGEVLEEFPQLAVIDGKPLTLKLIGMHSEDFAEVDLARKAAVHEGRNVICLNMAAMRDKAMLESEYRRLVESGWFVKGTDIESIAYHEIGHIYGSVYKVESLPLSRSIIGEVNDTELALRLGAELSKYAGSKMDTEVVAEVFSAWFSGVDNWFANAFMKSIRAT